MFENGNNMLEHLRDEVLSLQQYAQLQAAFISLNQNNHTDDETPPQEGEDFCVVCWDRRADRALLPCGHLCLCSRCSAQATLPQGNLSGRCPVCQCTVLGPMRVFRSGVPTPGDGSSIGAPTLPTTDDETSSASASLLRAHLISIASLLRAYLICIAKSIALCPIYPWIILLLGLRLVVITESYLASTTDIAVLQRWLLSTLSVIIVIVIAGATTFVGVDTAFAIEKRVDSCKASNATKNVIKVITDGFFIGIISLALLVVYCRLIIFLSPSSADSLPNSFWQCWTSIFWFIGTETDQAQDR